MWFWQRVEALNYAAYWSDIMLIENDYKRPAEIGRDSLSDKLLCQLDLPAAT